MTERVAQAVGVLDEIRRLLDIQLITKSDAVTMAQNVVKDLDVDELLVLLHFFRRSTSSDDTRH
jgi:hypothetical protein